MTATTCICSPAPEPYDHLLTSNPKCLAHNKAIQLVAAGWTRHGEYWSLTWPDGPFGNEYHLLTETEAYDILVSKRENPK